MGRNCAWVGTERLPLLFNLCKFIIKNLVDHKYLTIFLFGNKVIILKVLAFIFFRTPNSPWIVYSGTIAVSALISESIVEIDEISTKYSFGNAGVS